MKNGVIVLKLWNSVSSQSKDQKTENGLGIKPSSSLTKNVLKKPRQESNSLEKVAIKFIFHELILVSPFRF